MNRKTKQLWILSFLFIFVANMAGLMLNSNLTGDFNNDSAEQIDIDYKIIKPSLENNLYHVVGTNWSAAVSAGWCTGSGTESDPYIIEDLIIDCQDQFTGIEVENSSVNFIIQDCRIDNIGTGSSLDKGIYLNNASNGILRRNNFTSNAVYQYGIYLGSDSDNNFITENICNNIYKGIYLYEYCDNNTIYNNHINGSKQHGICIQGTGPLHYNNNISSNVVHDVSSTSGIEISTSSNSTIENNIVYNSNASQGIFMSSSNYSRIINNTVYNGLYDGIRVSAFNTQYIEVSNNYVHNNSEIGIAIAGDCSDVEVFDNTISNNGDNAIYIYGDNIEITRNTILNHTGDDVVFLHSNTDNALIQDNYFIGNTIGPADDGGTGDNHWNSSSIGNYWDDYGGNDLDNDGIGDSPLSIGGVANSFDYLPIFGDPFYDGGLIYINGSLLNGTTSWQYAMTRAWCSGTGHVNDTYLIEDLVVNANENDYGIQIDDTNNAHYTLNNCTVLNASEAGVYIYNSSDGNINNCDISYNDGDSVAYGIILSDTVDTMVSNCLIEYNTEYGISLANNLRTTITNNNIINNPYGVTGIDSNYITFSNNNLNTTFSSGMGFGNSNNLTISNNRITDTGNTGLFLSAVESSNVTRNTFGNNGGGFSLYMNQNNYFNYIYNNTFEYNSVGPAHENLAPNSNNWDYLGMGNAWFDYGGVDVNDDGIGDTARSISGTPPGIDNYPIFSDGIDENGGVISINGSATGVGAHNWTWAESKFWCSGSGVEEDPYVISDYYLWELDIDGNGANHGIEIVDSNFSFRIENLNITNCTGSSYRAIHLDNVTTGTIRNNNLSDNGRGIYGVSCNNITVVDNILSYNSFNGLLLTSCADLIIRNNSVFLNNYGIAVSSSDLCQIEENTVNNNSLAGIYVQTSNRTTILRNEVYYNGISTQAGIYIRQSRDIEVSFNKVIFNGQDGIKVYGDDVAQITENVIITQNNILYNNKTGILVEKDMETDILIHIEITQNNISFNGQARGVTEITKAGIGIEETCLNNTISNNYIANNTGSGIYSRLRNHNNTISHNDILNNEIYGIYFDVTCHENTIRENNIYKNEYDGIRLYTGCNDNQIISNSIFNNSMNGIHLFGVSSQNDNIIVDNTVSFNNFNGIEIASDTTILTNNTCTYNIKHGIYINEADFVNITECTASNNRLDGIRVEGSNNVSLLNNSDSFSFNGQYGIHLLFSNNSNITGNYIEGNEVGIYLNGSVNNTIDWNTIKDNPIGITQVNGLNYIGSNNVITGEYVPDDGGEPGNGTPPSEPPADIMIIIIIGIIIGAVAVVGGIAAKSKGPKESKIMKELREEEIQTEEKQELKIRAKQEGTTAPPILPKGPKKGKKAIEFEEDKQIMTQAELQELQKTEGEVAVEKKEFLCVVHKGPIEGDMYLCPKCHTLYCVKCANTLKERGEKCWSCETEIKSTRAAEDVDKSPADAPVEDPELKKQADIKKFDVFIEQAQAMVQKLDIKFGAGEIEMEDYMEKKNQLAQKIGEAMAKRDQLQE